MIQTKKHFFSSHKTAKFFATFALSLIILPFVADAAPAARTTVSRTAPNAGNRTPITKTNTNVKATNKQSATVTKTTTAAPEKTKPNITNKTSQFDDVISADDESVITDSALAAEIRRQRESMDNQTQIQDADATLKTYISGGKNECDTKLRSCMSQKCGNDFTKCSGDTDTLWGTKMESCRRDLPCTGEEYKLFAIEIKADRDANAELSLYNSIISCGQEYDTCITTQCGTNYSKCLGKKSGDAAIEKCKSIAKRCTEQDSGLASRTMSVFGNLRSFAEETVARDEARLYELRDLMRQTCERLGAKFDDRTLDCVYTVQFHAGEDNAVQASRKAYAGTTFACTPDWFGVDVTTYMENAFRLTREQTSASSAIMGAGVGLGVGAITSGAIGRSIDTAKAERDLNQKLCEDDFGTWNKTTHTCKCPSGQKFVKESGCEDKKTTQRGAKTDPTSSTTTTSTEGGGQPQVEPTNQTPANGTPTDGDTNAAATGTGTSGTPDSGSTGTEVTSKTDEMKKKLQEQSECYKKVAHATSGIWSTSYCKITACETGYEVAAGYSKCERELTNSVCTSRIDKALSAEVFVTNAGNKECRVKQCGTCYKPSSDSKSCIKDSTQCATTPAAYCKDTAKGIPTRDGFCKCGTEYMKSQFDTCTDGKWQ